MATVAILGVLATLIGLISIYVGAFRVHVIWGILMLIGLPIVLPVFMIRHLKLVRVGLLFLVIGPVAVSYAAFSEAIWPPHHYLLSLSKPENMGTLGRILFGKRATQPIAPVATAKVENEHSDSSPDKMTGNDSIAIASSEKPVTPSAQNGNTQTAVSKSPPPEVLEKLGSGQAQSTTAKNYVEFSMDELSAYFGYRVRITDIDNNIHEALLKDQDGTLLILEKQYGAGGAVEFRLESRNIAKMEALQP